VGKQNNVNVNKKKEKRILLSWWAGPLSIDFAVVLKP